MPLAATGLRATPSPPLAWVEALRASAAAAVGGAAVARGAGARWSKDCAARRSTARPAAFSERGLDVAGQDRHRHCRRRRHAGRRRRRLAGQRADARASCSLPPGWPARTPPTWRPRSSPHPPREREAERALARAKRRAPAPRASDASARPSLAARSAESPDRSASAAPCAGGGYTVQVFGARGLRRARAGWRSGRRQSAGGARSAGDCRADVRVRAIAGGISATASTCARSRIARCCATLSPPCATAAAATGGQVLARPTARRPRSSTRPRAAVARSVRRRSGPAPRTRRTCRRRRTGRAAASRDGRPRSPCRIWSGRWLAAGYRGTRLRDLDVDGRSASGRVARVRLEGMTPDAISGQDLRMVVGRTLGWHLLKSTDFTVRRTGAGYRFDGKGFGHGVGLCVLGSVRRAEHGESARDILRAYFPGLEIGRLPAAPRAPGTAEHLQHRRHPTHPTQPDEPDQPELRLTLPPSRRTRAQRADARLRAVPLPTSRARRAGRRPPVCVSSFIRRPRASGGKRASPGGRRRARAALESICCRRRCLRERGTLESTLRHELAHVLTAPGARGAARVGEGRRRDALCRRAAAGLAARRRRRAAPREVPEPTTTCGARCRPPRPARPTALPPRASRARWPRACAGRTSASHGATERSATETQRTRRNSLGSQEDLCVLCASVAMPSPWLRGQASRHAEVPVEPVQRVLDHP